MACCVLWVGCEDDNSRSDAVASPPAAMEMRAANLSGKTVAQPQPPAERKLIRTAHVSMRVDSLEDVQSHVQAVLQGRDAWVLDENQSAYGDRENLNLTIKVAQSAFDETLEALLTAAAKVENRSVGTEDVTEEYLDIETRLRVKRALEEQYLSLLKQAETVEDTLAVQRELANVREEIERIEGRLKYLESRVSYSTIHLHAYTETAVSTSFGDELLPSLGAGWENFLALILALLRIWPILILAGVIVYLLRGWRQRRAQRKLQTSTLV